MGGCRCTYRNCTVRSDGVTHFFHYPVFDKVRCHQWLTNAGRYDFLNLKVSQVKNRVVCQHHFADHCFMNSVKDKLKLEAIPTEDGPFCDSSAFRDSGVPKNMLGMFSLAYEDIENDEYVTERKENYNNVKYAEFLTNCELDNPRLNETCKTEGEDSKYFMKTENEPQSIIAYYNNNSTHVLNMQQNNSNNIINPNKSNINSMCANESILEQPATQNITNEIAKVKPMQLKNKTSKIRIISEKKITEPEKQIPVPVSIAFQTVSPSMILNVNKSKNKPQSDIVASKSNVEKEITVPELKSTIDPKKIEIEIDFQEMDKAPPIKAPDENKIDKSPKPVAHKKISAERLAAINEKRKFNMKLKDIIEAGLNRLDIQNAPRKKPIKKNNLLKSPLLDETVASSLSKESSLPSNNEYIISFLEARMQRMENLFLNKIDQNTQKIMDLKREFDVQKEEPPVSSISKKSSNLQGEAHKKYLFNEISKYLSPDVNSMVYEELFINKFKPNVSNSDPEPLKKRRRR